MMTIAFKIVCHVKNSVESVLVDAPAAALHLRVRLQLRAPHPRPQQPIKSSHLSVALLPAATPAHLPTPEPAMPAAEGAVVSRT
eukprot:1147821-Pelagomonas_calceolata.AAC.8